MREAPEFEEALLHGDLGDGGFARRTLLQRGMDRAKALLAQEGDGADAEYLVEGTVQAAAGQAELRADFGDVNRPGAGCFEIFLDMSNQPYRRRQIT